MNRKTAEVAVIAITPKGEARQGHDLVVCELPLTIILNGQEMVTALCSPADLEYMVAGILYSEGIIRNRTDIRSITIEENAGIARAETLSGKALKTKAAFKPLVASGGGKGASGYNLGNLDALRHNSQTTIAARQVFSLMRDFLQHSPIYQSTHGVHGAALCDSNSILVFNDDIGRHNALDKVFGQCLMQELPTEGHIVISSGRVSSEILLKVAKRGIAILISKSPPTDLGVKLANDLGITIIGSATEKGLKVYSHNWRVIAGGQQ
jgi:FdhD protein